ncbi:hypothetical protein GN244_ATG10596 [Phytophthora infestans]|uniref:Uncharacterized protein n=1 Tax=Phytophthora infestans TaxID=4787 RepID=A0A833WCL5_PHYIN|nr:hypothetical protein GN244_ATG10596 [Phytophthora infestans]
MEAGGQILNRNSKHHNSSERRQKVHSTCPKATTGEARELVKKRRKKGVATVSGHIPLELKGHITLEIGTEYSNVAESLVHNLRARKEWLSIHTLEVAAEAEGFGGSIVLITHLDVGVETLAGKLILANVVCRISPEELPAGKGVREQHSVLDMEFVGPEGKGGLRQVMAVAMNLGTPVPTPAEVGLLPDEACAGFPESIGQRDLDEDRKRVWNALLLKIKEAEEKGVSVPYLVQLESFRLADSNHRV